MQQILTAQTADGTKVVGWLHRAGSDTLAVLVHGHNTAGTASRYLTIAQWLEHHGIDCLRVSVTRPQLAEKMWRVTTVTEEIRQVEAISAPLKDKYKRLVFAGHSQGGIIALKAAIDMQAAALVQIMGVFRTKANAREKLKSLGINVPHLPRDETVPISVPNGATFVYGEDFFEDIASYDVARMLQHWHGPTLFIYGEQDTTILKTEVVAACACANTPKKLVGVLAKHRFNEHSAMNIGKALASWLAHEFPIE